MLMQMNNIPTTANRFNCAGVVINTVRLLALTVSLLLFAGNAYAQTWVDHSTSDNSTIVKRHETGSVVSQNKLYALGGRGNRPTQVFDAIENKWSTIAPLPMELHHFQPVILNGYLYVIGAFTCCFPTEPTIADIYRLNLATNTWEVHGRIPDDRLRGSAGAVVYNDKIYLVGGNTNGHSGGAVGWLDEYDPANGSWRTLPDAPNARDHFSAAVVGNKLVAASGRQSNIGFGGMVAATNVFDFNTNTWSNVDPIPTPRAGAMLGVKNGNIIIIGGETNTQIQAHDEVEAFNVASSQWRSLPSLNSGRHGGASGVIGDTLHAISGNLNRGGVPEVTIHETLLLNDTDNDGLFNFEDNNTNLDNDNDGLSNQVENQLQTDPLNPDSDGDGLTDGDEVNTHGTDPLSNDTDNDGLSDNEEISLGTNPALADSDSDTLSDNDELQIYFTDPLLSDSDNDGLNDNEEVLTYNTNPNTYDSDGDGISDATEVAEGSNPANNDEDGDGILNSAEGTADTDGDSVPDFTDLDSDNDGIPDIIENGRVDADNNGKLDDTDQIPASDALIDTDQDGIENLFDLDSDQDGIIDFLEAGFTTPTESEVPGSAEFIDLNTNGWHDNFEGVAIADTDSDSTPDFLDLDSNDDGVTDLTSSGIVDSNDDGQIDTFVDSNNDGVHDDLASLERIDSEQNTNNEQNNITNQNTETGTENEPDEEIANPPVSSSGGGSDPMLPFLLLAWGFFIARRRLIPGNPILS